MTRIAYIEPKNAKQLKMFSTPLHVDWFYSWNPPEKVGKRNYELLVQLIEIKKRRLTIHVFGEGLVDVYAYELNEMIITCPHDLRLFLKTFDVHPDQLIVWESAVKFIERKKK